MLASFRHDLHFGWRMLLKQPGFTLVALITLSLGIGANTAIFSVVNAVLLRPLPYKEPQQLVWVQEVQAKRETSFSPAEFLDYQSQNHSLSEMAAYRLMPVTLTGRGAPEQLDGLVVTANYFSLLGVPARIGRIFQAEDGRPGAPRVAILSHPFWQQRFGGDTALIGKTLTLSGEPATVVGVMPSGFQDNSRQIWLNPRRVVPDWMLNSPVDLFTVRNVGYLRVLARLKPNVTLEQARADLETIAGRLQQQYPRPAGHGVSLMLLHEQVVGNVRPTLLILIGAVGLVLLIACANVTSLMLARATMRYKEFAIRMALGARRAQIVRQLLLESFPLAVLGGAGGWLLALWSLDVLVSAGPRELPRLSEVGLDYQVLAFTFAATVLTALVFGLVPSLATSKPDLNSALKEGARTASQGALSTRLRQTIVVMEVALSVVVLIGAGLLVASFSKLLAVNPGFDPQNLTTMWLGLTDERYSQPKDKKRLVNELNARLEAIPGVQGVAICDDLPIAGTDSWTRVKVEGRQLSHDDEMLPVGLHVINPRYFDAMGIRLLKGRTFTERDDASAPSVYVINETLARRIWPPKDGQVDEPLGKRIRYNSSDPWGEVVGVVEDVKYDGLHLASSPHLYEPYQQNAWPFLAVAVRSQLDRPALMSAIQREVNGLDPNLPVSRVRTMDEVMTQAVGTRRIVLTLFSLFACVAMVLVAVGIYGVLAYSVTQRTRELGIRIALGATARDLAQLIVGQGMRLVLMGIAIGLVSVFMLRRAIENLLFDVSPTDPLTYGAILLLLVVLAISACWLPARRATKVDPLAALRSE